MRTKKRNAIKAIFVVIVLGAVTIFAALPTVAYRGFHGNADCSLCHNNPASAHNNTYETAQLTLDGKHHEVFWNEDFTYGRRTQIPVVGPFGAGRQMITIIFAQNRTHLFILVRWEDPSIHGTDQPQEDPSDG
ncbi:MAG: hypothetical protein ACXABY_14845, partial [Candidatus Thorarchaeota archaeon]